MRLFTLFLLVPLVATSASAASYQKRDGTIVDPIRDLRFHELHSYSGAKLEPLAPLRQAHLFHPMLAGANLTGAKLSYAKLSHAYLRDATFSTGTILKDEQTVVQPGFDVAGLPGVARCL